MINSTEGMKGLALISIGVGIDILIMVEPVNAIVNSIIGLLMGVPIGVGIGMIVHGR